ncbi:3-deoxy-7-phosphoheptulonate synthase [Paraferrimonas sp. SM1919]|uniref:3-deoxy-7-phosphoheptulonate synthase n=1 Tax=Paraferrimonas sp. SM1919 TaxID=2662263 RepID=UPI0013D47D86|nr:3-deoxy-7-phosphoheptulonate synthase [Paraferrimonas sp. SM1919]
MDQKNLHDVHIAGEQVLITPQQLSEKLPLSEKAADFIANARKTVSNIVHKRDNRLLVVTGPCSIHDIDSAKEYALKLKELSKKVDDQLYIVMRVYFEKPRTTVGWKGLINDPNIDGSFEVEQGLHTARELLIWLAELEMPVATEALDPISPQYLSELISWSAIGARTTESQTHREMASGLSMPVGFKNGTDGKLQVAIDALKAATHSHRFMGINGQGQVALLQTNGNPDGHVILRGGKQPNYDSVNIRQAEEQLHNAKLNARLVVDCSHGNSNKNHNLQPLVTQNVVQQIVDGNKSIIGIMLESHLNSGNQSSDLPKSQLQYGVSITDACIDWQTTEELLMASAAKLAATVPTRFEN